MSFRSKQELLQQTAPRYQEATEPQKVAILHEFVAATGYARKYAIRRLNHPGVLQVEIERSRAPRYGSEVQEALHLACLAANRICAKRLVPFLPTLVESLERHGHLQLSPEVRAQLLTISSATADRLLRRYRVLPRTRSMTRAGTLKLQSKQREGSRVHRKYEAAQTPLARLCASGVLNAEQVRTLEQVAQILDPVQLLAHLEHLQKALWRHAILSTAQPQHAPAPATVNFSLEPAAPEQAANDPAPEAQVEAKPLPLRKRRHKKYEKSRRPHDWRSRPDPFEGFWDQITTWLIANPERTGVSEMVRDQVVVLAHGFCGRLSLTQALRLVWEAIGQAAGRSIAGRADRPSASRLLLACDDGLT